VVPGDSPAINWVYATGLEPAPSAVPPTAGARVPKLSLQTPGLVAE
jgi:hypothetical protein